VRSSSARSKKSASPDFPFADLVAVDFATAKNFAASAFAGFVVIEIVVAASTIPPAFSIWHRRDKASARFQFFPARQEN